MPGSIPGSPTISPQHNFFIGIICYSRQRWSFFETFRPKFHTMPGDQKIRYLKIHCGRYFYQRRVPKHLHGPLNQKL